MVFFVIFAATMARHVRTGDRWLAHGALSGAVFGGVGFLTARVRAVRRADRLAVVVGRILPKWMGWVIFAFGLLCVAGPISFFALLATMLWVLVAGIWMVRQGPPVTDRVPEFGRRARPDLTIPMRGSLP